MFNKRKYTTIAIIGNGFDLAHNLNTDYTSFVTRTSSPDLDKFKLYCDNESSITKWSDFENNINILTQKLLIQSYSDDYDYDDANNKIDELNIIFSKISILLINYLKNEIASKPFLKKESISKYINKNTIAINFNYTDTVKNYINNVINIHGSLSENDIVLGYDYRDEPCLADYSNMCWSKDICRNSLEFRRCLKKNIFIGKNKYNSIVSALNTYYIHDNSPRGIDEETKKLIPHYWLIKYFTQKHIRQSHINKIKYANIDTIIVLGHSIEADIELLKNIFSRCFYLKKVVIFRYEGESDLSFNTKKDFFTNYCKNIETVFY